MDRRELLDLAARYFILDDGTSEANLVRRIQRAQGALDCFATARVRGCSQTDCRWRRDCIAYAGDLDNDAVGEGGFAIRNDHEGGEA